MASTGHVFESDLANAFARPATLIDGPPCIETLPNELLEKVFGMALQEGHGRQRHQNLGRILETCRLWKQAAEASPSLWATLPDITDNYIDYPTHAAFSRTDEEARVFVGVIHRYLQRSRDHPLTFRYKTFNHTGSDTEVQSRLLDILEALLLEKGRWGDVNLMVSLAFLRHHLLGISRPGPALPLLFRLSLTVVCDVSDDMRIDLNHFAFCENLQHADVNISRTGWLSLSGPIQTPMVVDLPWSKLKTYSYRDSCHGGSLSAYFQVDRSGGEPWLQNKVELTGPGPYIKWHSARLLAHPELVEVLHLSFRDEETKEWFSQLSLPNLAHLTLSTQSVSGCFGLLHPFVQDSGRSLVLLNIARLIWDEELIEPGELSKVLFPCPLLEDLRCPLPPLVDLENLVVGAVSQRLEDSPTASTLVPLLRNLAIHAPASWIDSQTPRVDDDDPGTLDITVIASIARSRSSAGGGTGGGPALDGPSAQAFRMTVQLHGDLAVCQLLLPKFKQRERYGEPGAWIYDQKGWEMEYVPVKDLEDDIQYLSGQEREELVEMAGLHRRRVPS